MPATRARVVDATAGLNVVRAFVVRMVVKGMRLSARIGIRMRRSAAGHLSAVQARDGLVRKNRL